MECDRSRLELLSFWPMCAAVIVVNIAIDTFDLKKTSLDAAKQFGMSAGNYADLYAASYILVVLIIGIAITQLGQQRRYGTCAILEGAAFRRAYEVARVLVALVIAIGAMAWLASSAYNAWTSEFWWTASFWIAIGIIGWLVCKTSTASTPAQPPPASSATRPPSPEK